MCVLILLLLSSDTFLIQQRIHWDIIINVKYSLFLLDSDETWIFSTVFQRSHINFTKVCPVGVELYLAATCDEANTRFPQFYESAE
jgi:hypothetical protein